MLLGKVKIHPETATATAITSSKRETTKSLVCELRVKSKLLKLFSLSKYELHMEISTRRSLRSVPPTYAPSLVFSHGKKYNDQTFCTIADGLYHVRCVPEMCQVKCIATYYGWLLLQKYFSTECYLFDPITLTKIDLPPLMHYTYNIGVLTSPPTDPNCVVMFFSDTKTQFIFCRIGDNNWTAQVLDSKKKNLIPKIGVSCKGKIYLLSIQGVEVIAVHNTYASVEAHKTEGPAFSIPESCFFTNSFVESRGEIFQVCRTHFGASDKTVRRLDVFKLEISAMAWEKVESLGDRIFLLGTSSTSLSSTELGVKGNCIYFFCAGYTNLYRFDMDDGTITSSVPCPKEFPQWRGPFWVVPSCKLQVKKEVSKGGEDKNQENQNEPALPPELLESILSRLFLGDCIRFRLTCKSWMSMTPPIRSYNLVKSKPESQQVPWLLSFLEKKGECNFYHPIYSDVYTVNHPEIAGATIRHAKYGWLLMSRGRESVFFFNPSTMETIKLPDLDSLRSYNFVNISFSAPPTSSDFVVFGHNDCNSTSLRLVIYCKGEPYWYYIKREIPYQFLASQCSPVLCDGVFYSLGVDGKLGIFNPNEEDEEKAWEILPDISVPQFIVGPSLFDTPIRSFIVECDGEILSVFVGVLGKQIWIFKLDKSKMKWVRVENLGDKVMFISNATCMLVPACLKGIENRIYFSRFRGKDSVFYSLSTGKYQSFGSRDSRADWANTCEHLSCTWI